MLFDPPRLDEDQHIERRGPPGDLVLARLEIARVPAGEGQEHEPHAAPDRARRVQTPGDVQHSLVRGNVDQQRLRVERGRRGEDLVRHAHECAGRQQYDEAEDETQLHDFPV